MVENVDMAGTWCDKHWTPFREGVEAGTHAGLVATALLAQSMFWSEEFMVLCGDTPEERTPARINVEMQKLGHLCCWFGDRAMVVLLVASMIPKPNPDLGSLAGEPPTLDRQ